MFLRHKASDDCTKQKSKYWNTEKLGFCIPKDVVLKPLGIFGSNWAPTLWTCSSLSHVLCQDLRIGGENRKRSPYPSNYRDAQVSRVPTAIDNDPSSCLRLNTVGRIEHWIEHWILLVENTENCKIPLQTSTMSVKRKKVKRGENLKGPAPVHVICKENFALV